MKKLFLMIPFLSFILLSAELPEFSEFKTFETDFVQHFTSLLSGEKSVENGHIWYQAPSDIRFDYIDGKNIARQYFVTPSEVLSVDHGKKSIITRKESADMTSYLVFLKGFKVVKESFDVAEGNRDKAIEKGIVVASGENIFRLTPKSKIAGVDVLFVTFLKDRITSVVIVNGSSFNQIVFSNSKFNVSIKKDVFRKNIPSGYEKADF